MSLGTSGWDQPRLLSVMLEYRLVSWTGRAGGAAMLAAIGLTWACLISWSSTDPSLTHTTAEHARNYLGSLGAVLSDLLLQTLGLATLVILLPPMFWGLELMTSGRVPGFGKKLAFYPLAVLVLAGALSAIPALEAWPMANGYGGILGDLFFSFGASLFSAINAERAGPATGIALLGLGFAMLAGSLGLQSRDLLQLLLRARSQGALRDLAGTWQQSLWAEAQRLKSSASAKAGAAMAAAAGASAFPASTSTAAPFSATPPACPIEPVLPDPRPARPEPAKAPAAETSLSVEPRISEPLLPEPKPEPEPKAERHAESSRPAPADTRDAPWEADSEDEIDDADEGSRAIAQRFAPANVRRDPAPLHRPGSARRDAVLRREPELPSRAVKPWAGLAGPRRDPRRERPSLNLLDGRSGAKAAPVTLPFTAAELAQRLIEVLALYGVHGGVRDVTTGPLVTLVTFEPARGIKGSRVISLADDVARCLGVDKIRIAAMPGSSVLGIELPSRQREPLPLRNVLESRAFRHAPGYLPIALGQSIAGEAVVIDLAEPPFLLIAGAPGSGKRNLLKTVLMSLLFRQPMEDCRLLLIGSQSADLQDFELVPHRMSPVGASDDKARAALHWIAAEIQERQKRLAKLGARSLETFNNRVRNARVRGEAMQRVVQTGFDRASGAALYEMQPIDAEPMARIVVVVAEIAELSAEAGRELEALMHKLAPVAAAVGIHAVLGTERPSADTLTAGLLAGSPARIALKVATKRDSRAILDTEGAEQLLGENDMLYASGSGQIVRVHAPAVTEKEVQAIVRFLRQNAESDEVCLAHAVS